MGSKPGSNLTFWKTIAVVMMIALIAGVVYIAPWRTGGKTPLTATDIERGAQSSTSFASTCPTDGDASVVVNVYNSLNESAQQNYDVQYYITNEKGSVVASGSDTTNPTAVTVNCGGSYDLYVVAQDADGGDNTQIQEIIVNDGAEADLVGGKVHFNPTKANVRIDLGMNQHGILSFKAKDNLLNAYAYEQNVIGNSAFQLDGVVFRSGDNATAFAVTNYGELDFSFDVKGTASHTDAQDAYTLLAIEAPVDKWAKPSVAWDGKALTDIKGQLSGDEATALNSYEYVYKITGSIHDVKHKLDFYMKALNADPTADVELDFAEAGNYLATNGKSIKTSAYKDDSSHTAVFTVQDITVDVS